MQAAAGFGAVTTAMFTGHSVEECKLKAPNCAINPEFLVGNTDIACQCAVTTQVQTQVPTATKPYYPTAPAPTATTTPATVGSSFSSFGPVTWAIVIGAAAIGASLLFKKKR